MKKTLVSVILLMAVQLACVSPLSSPPTATSTSLPPTPIPTATSVPPTVTPEATAASSADSSLVSITFTVVNKSTEALDLSWIDWQGNRGGQEEKYATIPAGESYEQQSYFADGWLIRNQAGNIVLLFFASEDDKKIITITADAVAVAKTNALITNGLNSLPGMEGLPVANVKFVNNSSVPLNLFWIDIDQNFQFVDVIPAGGNIEAQGLVFGSMVSVNDDDGNIALLYVATEDSAQTVTISDSAVAYRFGVNP